MYGIKNAHRNSNIELLRIIAMMFIIAIHYLNSSNAENLIDRSINYDIYIIIETIISSGVNIFVLITGFFMCDKKEISIRKPINILFDVSFYGLVCYTISIILGINNISLSGLAKSVLPILAGYRWFVKAWIVMYIFSPYVNRMLECLDESKYRKLICIMMILFSIWPFTLPNPPIDDYGFGFVHFILMYVIGSYIRKFSINISLKSCFAILITSIIIIFTCLKLENVDFYVFNTMRSYALANNSPFIIIESITIFLICKRFKPSWYSKYINTAAASAFGVFLIHGEFNIIDYIFNNIFKAQSFYDNYYWIFNLSLCMILVYLGCFAVDYLKKISIDKVMKRYFDKIHFFNYKIEVK